MHSLINWDTFSNIDRFFDDEDWLPMIPMRPIMRGFTPAVDVSETDKQVIVETPLAGIKPQDVEISIKDDVLTIKGQTKKEQEEKKKNYYRKEIRSGSFLRSVSLPCAVKSDKAQAESEDGMLKILIPKAEISKPKKIAVKIKSVKK